MESRKIMGAVFLVLLLIGHVQGIDVSVKNSCGSTEEAMVSLNDTSGGHIAEPGYYDENEVCIEEVNYFEIRQNCQDDEKVAFTMQDLNNSHLSIYENEYSYKLCSPAVTASVKDSCGVNETKVLSVDSDNNTHAAAPSYTDSAYDQSLCFRKDEPQNVTLKLSGLSDPIYADGAQLNTGQSLTPPVGYPYIVSDQPAGIVDYGNFLKLSRPSSDTASITQEAPGSFLLPFTSNGYTEIEDERSEVVNKDFLGMGASFGFTRVGEPLVKVIYESPYQVDGFENTLSSGRNEISISNSGLVNGEVEVDISPN